MDTDIPVYVVDDDDAVRDSLQVFLESAGFAVQGFGSAEDFLDASRTLPPGCLLVDVRMPGMDGLELQERLAERTGAVPDGRFPAIVVTGHGDMPLAVRAMRAGAVDFVEKPFEDDAILEALGRAARRLDAVVPAEAPAPRSREAMERLAALTAREREVLERLVAGRANKVIAFDLGISPRTVEIHRARVMEKMQVRSLSELVRLALDAGVAAPEGS